MGYREAMRQDAHLLAGLNVHLGALTYEAVASAQNRAFTPAAETIAG